MTTPLYGLPEWFQNQNQPHVPVNTSLRMLEILAQLIIQDMTLTAPPTSVEDGDCYWIDGVGTDDWDDHTFELAMYIGTGWEFVTPRVGMIAWSVGDGNHVYYDGASSGVWPAL